MNRDSNHRQICIDTHYFPGKKPYVRIEQGKEQRFSYTWRELCEVQDRMVSQGLDPSLKMMVWKPFHERFQLEYGHHEWPDTEKRVVLVGELNPYQNRRDFDLYDEPASSAGSRLRQLILGVKRETYFRYFIRRNLCVKRWSMPAARREMEQLGRLLPGHVFVLLGNKVKAAAGFAGVKAFETTTDGSSTIVCLPHPSGLCRAWNQLDAFERARNILRKVCHHIPLGELG